MKNNNKKILIIEPPFYNLFGYKRWWYPITATLVGTYFKEFGNEVKVFDGDMPIKESKSLSREEVANNYHLYSEALENDNHPIWNNLKKLIENENPDIIGLTSISAKIDSANKIAKMAKQRSNGKIKVLLGGPHVQGMLRMFPDYDFGSYYDEIFPEIPNLIDRKPNKKLLIDHQNYEPKDITSLLTETGCPNICTFCCNSGNKKIVYRNLSSIEDEIQEINREYGNQESLKFIDDCFFSNEKRFNDLCNLISSNKFRFQAQSRIMSLSPEKIERFLESGGEKLHVGVESGSQKVLDFVKKNLKVEKIIEKTKLLNDYGVFWQAFFISGFPFETIDDLKLTEELVYKIQPSVISLNRFTPYPGTRIWKDYYMNNNFRFRDLFQQNPKGVVKLDPAVDNYITKMICDFDKYNLNKK